LHRKGCAYNHYSCAKTGHYHHGGQAYHDDHDANTKTGDHYDAGTHHYQGTRDYHDDQWTQAYYNASESHDYDYKGARNHHHFLFRGENHNGSTEEHRLVHLQQSFVDS
jgi:hypothetical protein